MTLTKVTSEQYEQVLNKLESDGRVKNVNRFGTVGGFTFGTTAIAWHYAPAYQTLSITLIHGHDDPCLQQIQSLIGTVVK